MQDIWLFVIDGRNKEMKDGKDIFTKIIRLEIEARSEEGALKKAAETATRDEYKTVYALRVPDGSGVLEQIQSTLSEIADNTSRIE